MALMPHFSAGPRSGGLFGSEHRLFTHAVQFYSDPGFLVRVLSGLVRSAFWAGDGVLLLATPEHRESLARQVRNEGCDLDAQRTKGCYAVMDPGEVLPRCSAGGKLDLSSLMELFRESVTRVAGASDRRPARVFVFGELVAVLSAQGNMEAALLVEGVWDGLVHRLPLSVLCAYPVDQFQAAGTEEFFLQICAAHSTLVPPDDYPTPESAKRILRAMAGRQSQTPSGGSQ